MNSLISRPIVPLLAVASGILLSVPSAEAGVILIYDSLLPGSGGSNSQLTRIDSQTDASFVSSSAQFSSFGSGVVGGFVHGTQSNVQGAFGDQNDLNFRFGSTPEVTLANGAVAASLASGNYVQFSFTANQTLTLDGFTFQLQVNSQNGSTYAARDSGLFIDVDGGGYTQFGTTDQGTNGINAGGVSFSGSVAVTSGQVVTYRLAFADKTNTSTNLQSATRIGDVQISAVPEPSAALLGGLGLLGLLRRRRG